MSAGSAALTHQSPGAMRRFARPLFWLGAAVLLVLVGWLVLKFLRLEAEPEIKHKVTQIQIVRPPPPPPPPPPKPPEKIPEPPKIKEEVKIDPPKPVETPKAETPPPEAPPPGPLGVDAQGAGPGDAFGLAGRPGGRDVTLGGGSSGPTIGGGGAPSALSTTLYANNVARQIAQELGRNGGLRNVEYRVDLRVWLDREGRIERHEIARSSGDPAIDQLIGDGLGRISAMRQAMPENMKQPLRIRVTSADA